MQSVAHRSHPAIPNNRKNGFLSPAFFCTSASFVLFLLIGGGPITATAGNLAMLIGGALCLCLAGSRGGLDALRRLPGVELLFVAAVIATVALQLVPLPPGLWQNLPGRDAEVEIFKLAGMSSEWLPASLDLAGTIATLAFTLALGGVFLAGLTFREAELRRLLWLMLGCAVLSIAIGAIQLSSSGQLTFYATSHRGLLLGFFANRNHQALFLAITIIAVGYLVGRRPPVTRRGISVFALYAVFALAAAFGTASRTGLALCFVAVLAAPFLFLGMKLRKRTAVIVGGVGAAALAALVGGSEVASGTLDRYGEVSMDYRWTMWRRSLPLMMDYFPMGTGFGAYPQVFMKYEQVDWLLPQFVNAVHNDYIQLIIEAGALGLGTLLLLGAVLFRSVRYNMRPAKAGESQGRALARFGLCVIGLVLLHSVVDYPLRRPAIAAIFALSLAVVLRQRLVTRSPRSYA